VRGRADELELVALQIHARDRLGYLLFRAGRAQEAVDAFEDAVTTAFRLGMEPLALDSLPRLVMVAAGKLGQFQRARAWSHVGKALVARFYPGSEAEAEMWNASGSALLREEVFAEAATELERADAMYAALHAEHPARVRTLQNIAWAQLLSDGAEAALRTGGRSTALAEKLYGATHPIVGKALCDRGELRIKANDNGGALQDLHRCISIIIADEGPRSPNLAMPWGGVALAELLLGNLDSATAAINAGFAVDFDKGSVELGGMLGRRAEIAFVRGDLEHARGDYQQSVAVRTERLGATSREARLASEQLAWVEIERGDLEAARSLVDPLAAAPPAVENKSELPLLQARLARIDGDPVSAEAALARARANGADASAVAIEASAIALAAGHAERALLTALVARPHAEATPYAFDAQLDVAVCRAATALGDLDAARDACARALAEAVATAPDHPRIADILVASAALEFADGNSDRARDLATRAVEVRRRTGQIGNRLAEAEQMVATATR
jgi:tetratricopeptide (TPR) repeat protein